MRFGNIIEQLNKRFPWLLTSKSSNLLAWLCFVLILLLLSKVCAQCFWKFFPNYVEPSIGASQQDPYADANHNYVDDLLSFGIFPLNLERLKSLKGIYGSNASSQKGSNPLSEKQSTSHKETIVKIPLTITGILASSDRNLSQTVILYNGNESLYSEGDVIEGTSAKVVRIYVDKIDVKFKDQLFTYLFDTDKNVVSAVDLNQGNEDENSKKQETVANDGKQKIEKISANNLLDFVTISPIKDGNVIKGYRLNPGRKAELFSKAGFKNNDVAIMVNGYDLTNPDQAKKLFKEYTTMRSFEITVDRGGIIENIYLDLVN